MVEGITKVTGLLGAGRRRGVRGGSSGGGNTQKNLRNRSFDLFAISRR